MSYCRFSEADVYIFEHVDGYFQCCACPLESEVFASFDCNTKQEMLEHIKEHRKVGHYVPEHVDETLEAEIFQDLSNTHHLPDDAGEYAEGLTKILERIPEGWGRWISCGKGWYPLLIELDEKLAEIDPSYEVHQAKEKFGTLRYYIFHDVDNPGLHTKMASVVSEYEKRSATTCESCGSYGTLKSEGYIVRTLCDTCGEKEGYTSNG